MGSIKACPDCGSSKLMTRGNISGRGGYGPDLLPGTGGVFTPPKLRAVVCKDCGFLRFYVGKDTLKQVSPDNGWFPVDPSGD